MSIEDDIALLEEVPSFSVLGRDALRVLAIGSESRTLEQGETLFREGEAADCGYVVEEGELTAVPKGRMAQPIAIGRATLLGELSLLAETRRPATVTAAGPAAVMRIPRSLFLKMLQGYPDVAERLRQTMLARTERMVEELALVRNALDVSEETARAEK